MSGGPAIRYKNAYAWPVRIVPHASQPGRDLPRPSRFLRMVKGVFTHLRW